MSKRSNKKLIKNNEELTKEEINELKDNEFHKKNTISNSFFENSYYCINYSCGFVYKTIKIIIKVSGVYLLWIFLHFSDLFSSRSFLHLLSLMELYKLIVDF